MTIQFFKISVNSFNCYLKLCNLANNIRNQCFPKCAPVTVLSTKFVLHGDVHRTLTVHKNDFQVNIILLNE